MLAADFAYTDELVRRCSTFRQTSGSEPPSTVRLLSVPAVGEKAYATVSSTPAGSGTPPAAGTPPTGTVALQVLQGTLSIGLSRQAPPASSDNELKTVLEPLLRLAQRLVDQPANGSPPAASPPAASPPHIPEPPRQAPKQTPEQLARLLQGITGPDGATARILAERYSPTAPARVPVPSVCTYDDAAYLAALDGAATVVAEIPGTQHRPAQISLRLVSLPAASSGPSPFDSRAAALGRCSSIREKLPGGGSRTWAALRRLAVDTSGETGYALVYALPDGTGVRHVLVGARKGRLVVETETEAPSDGAVLQAARGLAATINKVMARVGN